MSRQYEHCGCSWCLARKAQAYTWACVRGSESLDCGFEPAIVTTPQGPFVRVGRWWISWHGDPLDAGDIASLRAIYGMEPIVEEAAGVVADDVEEPRFERRTGWLRIPKDDDAWLEADGQRIAWGSEALSDLGELLEELRIPPLAHINARPTWHGPTATIEQKRALANY